MPAPATTPGAAESGQLRVAIDAGPLHGHRTGVGVSVAALLSALQRRGDVDVVPYVTSMRAKVTPPERRLLLPAAAALRLWYRRLPELLERGLRVDRRLAAPAVVHGTNYVVPPARCSRLVTVHDCWFLEHPTLATASVRLAGNVLRRAIDDGAHVLAPSNATAAQVRELLGTDRVTRIHHGPPPPPLDPPPARPARLEPLGDAPFLLAIGTLERRKNYPTLVRAFSRVANEHEQVRLVIAGANGNDRASTLQTIAALGPDVQRRVHLLGPVDALEKDWLLRAARALAYPSLDEGFGFPVLEAQQIGTPVVTSTAGSIPEIAGSAALFSTPNDADALAANLFWVLTDDREYATLASRGHANLRRFSWDRTAAHHVELYSELASA